MLLNNMKGVTNGAQGLRGIERYNCFGYRVEGTIPYYYMVLIVAILVGMVRLAHRQFQVGPRVQGRARQH